MASGALADCKFFVLTSANFLFAIGKRAAACMHVLDAALNARSLPHRANPDP